MDGTGEPAVLMREGPDGAPADRDVGERAAFTRFVREAEPALWQALAPRFDAEVRADALAEAFAYAWRHWPRVRAMDNPRGYVYRAAERGAVALHRQRGRSVPADLGSLPPPREGSPVLEPDLDLIAALRSLTEMQRTVVYLVEGCHWRLTEVAELLDLSVSTVRNHRARALTNLRARLETEGGHDA